MMTERPRPLGLENVQVRRNLTRAVLVGGKMTAQKGQEKREGQGEKMVSGGCAIKGGREEKAVGKWG